MGALVLVVITFYILHSFEASNYRFGSPEWRKALKGDIKRSQLLLLLWLPLGVWAVIKFVVLTIACFKLGGMYIGVYFAGIFLLALLWYFLWRIFIEPV